MMKAFDFVGSSGLHSVAAFFLGCLLTAVYMQTFLRVDPAPLTAGARVFGGDPARATLQLATGADEPSQNKCVEPEFNISGPGSDWYYLKAVPPLAPCAVRGFPIENLEPQYNFRRAFMMGYTTDVEDKTHILPFLRAAHDPSLATRKRRVLLDLGSKTFESSVLWFLRYYPLEFTEIHAFEVTKGLFTIPGHSEPLTGVVEGADSRSKVQPWGQMPVPNEVLDRVTLHEAFVGVIDEPGVNGGSPKIDITRFIKNELKLTPQDAVIVKMDIEYAEWDVLPAWLQDPEMPEIVDELFVEVHYSDPTMAGFGWTRGPPREKATKLFQDLRAAGFFVHAWP